MESPTVDLPKSPYQAAQVIMRRVSTENSNLAQEIRSAKNLEGGALKHTLSNIADALEEIGDRLILSIEEGSPITARQIIRKFLGVKQYELQRTHSKTN